MVEYIVIGFTGMKDVELDAHFLFTEGFENIVNEVPVFRDFVAGVLIKHHFAEYGFIKWFVVLSRQN